MSFSRTFNPFKGQYDLNFKTKNQITEFLNNALSASDGYIVSIPIQNGFDHYYIDEIIDGEQFFRYKGSGSGWQDSASSYCNIKAIVNHIWSKRKKCLQFEYRLNS